MVLLIKLLVKNPSKRLGCMEKGEEEIKNHLFFKMINWVKLEAREVQPPFKPKIVSFYLYLAFFQCDQNPQIYTSAHTTHRELDRPFTIYSNFIFSHSYL